LVLDRRECRGIKLASQNHVQQTNSSEFLVRSEENTQKSYEVSWAGKQWICTCEDYRKRRRRCKHIHAVGYYLASKDLASTLRSNQQSDSSCPSCGSADAVIGHGWRYNKSVPVRRFLCKRCGVTFGNRSGFERMKNRAVVIAAALDLYFRGLSLRKISEHLETFHGAKVSYTTIHYWLSKFVGLVHGFVQNLPVKTGGRWHADDTLVRLKGRHMVLWGLLDSETRFLIAEHISRKRSSDAASKLFKKGCSRAQFSRNKPLELITDGLSSYQSAVERELKSSEAFESVIHIQGPLIGPIDNNRMERLFGTLKQRTKLALHFNNEKGANLFAKGFTTHYNYVRGHMALGGKTPAEAVGMSKCKLSWLDLIRMVSSKNKHGRVNQG
jgi:transposase-like protein